LATFALKLLYSVAKTTPKNGSSEFGVRYSKKQRHRSCATKNKQTNKYGHQHGITASLAQLAKAAETKTEMLASLKEDILLRTDSDEDEEPAPGTND